MNSGCVVSRVLEVVCALLGGEGVEDGGDGVGDAQLRPGGRVAEQVLDFGEHLLDRVEVGRVFRQEQQFGAGPAKRITDSAALMATAGCP